MHCTCCGVERRGGRGGVGEEGKRGTASELMHLLNVAKLKTLAAPVFNDEQLVYASSLRSQLQVPYARTNEQRRRRRVYQPTHLLSVARLMA